MESSSMRVTTSWVNMPPQREGEVKVGGWVGGWRRIPNGNGKTIPNLNMVGMSGTVQKSTL